jgi:hypothetical protein
MQSPNPGGMSKTPQGVDAQQQMVDITTNNYQKAIEAFFSHYCSYALTIYFQELKAVKRVHPTAEARIRLLEAGLDTKYINDDGTIDVDFEDMSVEFFVRCVPGSLVEMEDEKQLRILNQLFIPLSQSMPAIVATQNPTLINQATTAMKYIVGKQIELSGAASAKELGLLWNRGDVKEVDERDQRITSLEDAISGLHGDSSMELEFNNLAIRQLQEQMSQMTQNQQVLLEKLGVVSPGSVPGSEAHEPTSVPEEAEPPREPYIQAASA